jgi:Uri superfamily endonuclease
MDKGIYCLVLKNPGRIIRVGARGDLTFRRGWHIYVGSALGSAGLQRLCRHISLAHLRDKRPKWHIDYLLTNSDFSLRYAVYSVTSDRLECGLARELNHGGIPRFGCSDCGCISHLFYRQQNPLEEIFAAFRHIRLEPVTKTIMNP